MVKSISTTCFCLLLLLKVFAQNTQLINEDFRGLNFLQFADKIESNYSYYFYFDKTETDSVQVNIVAHNFTIQQLLDTVLKGTTLHFAVDSLNRVFITNKLIVQTSLPSGYFSRVQNIDSTVTENIEENTEEPKEKLRVSIENKLIYVGSGSNNQGNATIAGYVRDLKSGEAIIGASVYIDTPRIGVNTDQYGYYSITLSKGYHTLNIISTGMKQTKRQIMLKSDGKLNVDLEEYVANLKAVLLWYNTW